MAATPSTILPQTGRCVRAGHGQAAGLAGDAGSPGVDADDVAQQALVLAFTRLGEFERLSDLFVRRGVPEHTRSDFRESSPPSASVNGWAEWA
jgi:hypothetical protein